MAFERLSHLVADRDADNTVRPRDLPIEHAHRTRPAIERPARVPLERLEVVGVTAVYPSGAGVRDVSFAIERGQLVVLTGPIGSGKSTLLRAILGLAWQAEVTGDVRWNGTPLVDRAAFLVPPNAAFLPQVPQLVSDTLAANIAFDDADDLAIADAITMAVMGDDVAAMPAGTATAIGPRGLRLSGGQRQRLAGARAVVHRPELVVLDDLSSALDVETELQLWSNFAAAGMTVLAVSHRAVAFERADRVIELAAQFAG